jgi:hypothetical protein
MRVLIVEDEIRLARNIAAMLREQASYAVDISTEGEDGQHMALKPGDEHPVDLEDGSAQKAVRIDRLPPGQRDTQDWPMRLIEAGKFGVALTVVDPDERQPIISDLLVFDIQSKPMLNSGRVTAVAIGVPLLLLLLYGLRWVYTRTQHS